MKPITIQADEYVTRGKKKKQTTHEVVVTTLGPIKEAVQALDGECHTMVSFFPEERSANLCVSGGNGGRYFVTVTEGINDAFHTLLDPHLKPGTNADEELLLVTGGQEVTKSRSETVDLKTALKAAVHWAKCYEMLPSLRWRRDG